MISKDEAKQLKRMIREQSDATELLHRYHQGYTNKSYEEVSNEVTACKVNLRRFVDSITE